MKAVKNKSLEEIARGKIEAKVAQRQTNRVEVVIGGRKRVVVVGMAASMYISELIKTGAIAANMYSRYIEVTYLGLKREENDIPEDFSSETTTQWIDDMELSEQSKLFSFIDEAMGFIIADYVHSMEALSVGLGMEK